MLTCGRRTTGTPRCPPRTGINANHTAAEQHQALRLWGEPLTLRRRRSPPGACGVSSALPSRLRRGRLRRPREARAGQWPGVRVVESIVGLRLVAYGGGRRQRRLGRRGGRGLGHVIGAGGVQMERLLAGWFGGIVDAGLTVRSGRSGQRRFRSHARSRLRFRIEAGRAHLAGSRGPPEGG